MEKGIILLNLKVNSNLQNTALGSVLRSNFKYETSKYLFVKIFSIDPVEHDVRSGKWTINVKENKKTGAASCFRSLRAPQEMRFL